MARRYQADELLRLRASPLVAKPDSLPPAEEWMGPIPDPSTQKKHSNNREQSAQTEPANQRPSLFATRHISRNSNSGDCPHNVYQLDTENLIDRISSLLSEDIVLGPPKTSFASASRSFGKSIDATDRPSARSNDLEDTKNDRYNFREKFFKDREYTDRDTERRDTRPGLANGRRGGRDDKEDWTGGRPRRTFGQEDTERRVRRNGDSDRWDSRDLRDHRDQQESGFERGGREKDQGRFPQRRDAQGRGKHDQSWFRDGETQDTTEHEEEKTSVRNREWRRGNHGADRDWNRSTKHEQDPEWMDSTDRDESKEAHTQEDFQRWKERMKAGSAAPPEEKKESVPEQEDVTPKPAETKRGAGEMFSTLDPSFQMDSALDKFFGLWGENKAGQDTGTENATDIGANKEAAPVRAAKPSRFAGFFTSPVEPAATKEAESTTQHDETVRPVSTDADQEGFQRILQMLGGGKSRNATPQDDAALQQSRPPPLQHSQTDLAKPTPPLASPVRESFSRQEYLSFQESSRDRAPLGSENLLAHKSPKDIPAHNRDTEFLLRLMQQSKISPPHPQSNPQPASTGHTPGVLNAPDVHSRPQGMQKQKPPVYLEDPAIANLHRSEPNDPRDQLRRRGTNGLAMGYYDDISFPAASQGNQIPNSMSGARPQGHAQLLMGIQRPPGFEQIPPGWANHQLQHPQQGGPNPLGLPPGLSNPPNRSMNPSFPSGPPMPLNPGMPPQNDRQNFPRGVAGGGGLSGFGPPPGMMPPPGYMNMNVPPPSAFPPLPHTPDGMMGLPHSNPAHYGGGPLQGPPLPSSRQLIDMFGQVSGGGPGDGSVGGRNGTGIMGPGPYR